MTYWLTAACCPNVQFVTRSSWSCISQPTLKHFLSLLTCSARASLKYFSLACELAIVMSSVSVRETAHLCLHVIREHFGPVVEVCCALYY